MPSDRRTFLRQAAALGVLAPVAGAAACWRSDPERAGDGPDTVPQAARLVTDPTLVPGRGDTVHVLAPAAEPAVAYLSRGDMRVYLDPAYRDWAEHRLAAYVSVTTGLWRIPRPEDDPRVPITPGDELREFEVVDLALRDPGMTPLEGDVRLRLGAPVPVRIEMSCVPLPGGDAWISSGAITVLRRDGPVDAGGREDFVVVGTGTRHGDAACTTRGDTVRILTWACPPEGG
jgi:hypothetical protein